MSQKKKGCIAITDERRLKTQLNIMYRPGLNVVLRKNATKDTVGTTEKIGIWLYIGC